MEEQAITFKVGAFRVIDIFNILVKIVLLNFNISQSISISISHRWDINEEDFMYTFCT